MHRVTQMIADFEASIAAYKSAWYYADALQRGQLAWHIKLDSDIVADLQNRFPDV